MAVLLFPFLMLFAQQGLPSGTWWDSTRDPAVWIASLAGVGVVSYGLHGIATSGDKERAEILADLERIVRRAFIPINAHLRDVPINQLGVHIWTTQGDDLKRLIKFRMEQQRIETPIKWCRGKGAIGIAWEHVRAVTADLTELYEEADTMDAATFDAHDREHRYGLTHSEVLVGARYKSVLAWPLAAGSDVIGVLSVDCDVTGQARQLSALRDDRTFQDVLGSCEAALRRYLGR